MSNGDPRFPASIDPLRALQWRRPDAADVPSGNTPADVRTRPRLSRIAVIESTQGASASKRTDIQQLPPWLWPPFGAFILDLPQNVTPVSVAVGGTLTVSLPAIPNGMLGIVDRLGFSTSDTVNTSVTTRINQNPVPPYGSRIGGLEPIINPAKLAAPIEIPVNSIFDVFVTNLGAAIITVAVRIMGWWYASD